MVDKTLWSRWVLVWEVNGLLGKVVSPRVDNALAAKKHKRHKRFHHPLCLCASCAFLRLRSVLHPWLGIFLEEVADIDRQAF